MSTDLDLVLTKVENLTLDELLTVQEKIIRQVRTRTVPPTQPIPEPKKRVRLPHAYRRTAEEIEASLKAIFTPEELARMGQTDFSKIKIGPKSASEMLNEDREDRF
jgi:hypothetical protein